MKIWVDADACPSVIKEILFRAAERTQIPVTLIANQRLHKPPSNLISTVQVPGGFDVADDEIVRRTGPGDLVITSDIPLAAQVIEKQALALSPRGELFSKNNIGARLSMRDFLNTMRSAGEHTGGPAPFNNADKKHFADQLGRLLASQSTKRLI